MFENVLKIILMFEKYNAKLLYRKLMFAKIEKKDEEKKL